MKIRTSFNEDERVRIHSPIYAAFLGSCHGVVLTARGGIDPHVCFTIIVEDDNNWFVSSESNSLYWGKELVNVLNAAIKFAEKNCVQLEYGYRFTPDQLDNPLNFRELL